MIFILILQVFPQDDIARLGQYFEVLIIVHPVLDHIILPLEKR